MTIKTWDDRLQLKEVRGKESPLNRNVNWDPKSNKRQEIPKIPTLTNQMTLVTIQTCELKYF